MDTGEFDPVPPKRSPWQLLVIALIIAAAIAIGMAVGAAIISSMLNPLTMNQG